ncbi:pentatricopeptide repeat-containing protein At2g26790, mitochondrial-like [Arachis duranensis]|uniref:Pentatricopeptide repeat-containing protein At2g26790, mitochondrial-like n=1 Tax=Arachis duranensis TaxID=130453 RepID=A0A6P4DN50_ARADU|nr:pentatricopeptide repeat-containing protein At2g26790, mitochondrial-like [Arachis duranensis]
MVHLVCVSPVRLSSSSSRPRPGVAHRRCCLALASLCFALLGQLGFSLLCPRSASDSAGQWLRFKFPITKFTHSSKFKFKFASTAALAHFNDSHNDFSESEHSSSSSSSSYCSSNNITNDNIKEESFHIVKSLQNNPSLAFSFFTQLKQQQFVGFPENISTYAAIIRIFCYWGLNRRLTFVFLDLIALSKQHPSFEIHDLFELLLDDGGVNGGNHNYMLRAIDAYVKACIVLKMFDEAIDFLSPTRRHSVVPNILTCNFLINRLVENGKVDMALAIYNQLKRLGLCPNHYTYAIVIKAFCKKCELEKAVYVFKEMEEARVRPDSYCYTAYIEGLCNNMSEMKLVGAEIMFSNMIKKGMVCQHVYSALTYGYCKSHKLSKALDLYEDMRSRGMFLDEVAYNIVFSALCKLGEVDDALDMVEDMKAKRMVLDIKHYTTLINGCFLRRQLVDAFAMIREMKEKGLKADIVTYNVIAAGLSRIGWAQDAVDLLDEMETQGVKPNSITHKRIIEGLCSAGKVVEAETFYQVGR